MCVGGVAQGYGGVDHLARLAGRMARGGNLAAQGVGSEVGPVGVASSIDGSVIPALVTGIRRAACSGAR